MELNCYQQNTEKAKMAKLVPKIRNRIWDGYLESTSEWWLEFNEIFLPYFRVTLTILKELEDVLGEDHIRYEKLLRSTSYT